MQVRARTYLTSGIAALGVGAIALTPIQPLPDHMTTAVPQRAVESLAVNLAASIDPFTPIVDTFKTSVANIETLVKFYLEKPFPLLQTIGANIGTYFTELTNGNASLIPEQINNNIKTFFQAPWDPGDQYTFKAETNPPTELVVPLGANLSKTDPPLLPGSGQSFSSFDGNLALLQVAGGVSVDPENPFNIISWPTFLKFGPAWNFLNTPYSGQLVGLLGPLLSPVVQLTKSFTAVGEYFKNGDVLGAINELINIPINMTNAFLNGAGTLDLTGVFNSIFGGLPDGATFGANLGGLLNTMPANGSFQVPNDPPTKFSGGAGFDSVAVTLGPKFPAIPGLPNGWFGSVVGLGQFLGEQLLVKPPTSAATSAAAVAKPAAAAPKAAAAVEAPSVAATPAVPAPPAVPATDEAPATPAAPATPSIPDLPAAVEAPSVPSAPAAEAPAPSHRGGGNNNGGGSSNSGHGHRGAA